MSIESKQWRGFGEDIVDGEDMDGMDGEEEEDIGEEDIITEEHI